MLLKKIDIYPQIKNKFRVNEAITLQALKYSLKNIRPSCRIKIKGIPLHHFNEQR